MGEPGMCAPGLCLTPLLGFGVPGNPTVETMLKEIDTQLGDNQIRIEECVKELMEMGQNMTGISQKFLNPSTLLDHITDNRIMDREMCFDPDPDAVAKLLHNVLSTIEKNPGCEEKILNQLYEISASEGLALPFGVPGAGTGAQSLVSINTAIDSADHVMEKLWNDVVIKIKKYYSEELKALPVGTKKGQICVNRDRAIQCVRGLCSLIPAENVWSLYLGIRSQQLDNLIKGQLTAVTKNKKSGPMIATVAEKIKSLVECIVLMMSDDFQLFNSGVFNNVITPVSALSEIYSERLTEEVTRIVDLTYEELSNGPGQKSPKKDVKRKPKEDMSKSPSDLGFLGHRKVGVKPQSKSADDLQSQQDDQFSDLQVLPLGYLQPLSDFVRELMVLQTYLDKLHDMMVWETPGKNISVKTKPKSNLKSALKSSHAPEDGKKSTFSPRSFEQSGLLPEAIPPPFGATQAMIAHLSASLKVVEKTFDDRILWSWRRSFAKLAPDLAKSVEYHIQGCAENVLQSLDAVATGGLAMVEVDRELAGGRLDYPVKVAKCIGGLMREIDNLLPLAKAGPDGPFTLIRAAFIEATGANLKHVHKNLSQIISNGVGQVSQGLVYDVLSTMAYIRNHILFYENSLGTDDNGKKTFPTLYRHYCEGVDTLSRQIIEHHNQVLVTSLMHDAESHHWEDSKDFYEGERCSFAIHMWYCHLVALRHTLWTTCPPKLAQSMLCAILQESLSVFCHRYVKIKPSYRRTANFRTDITAILACASELMYYTCGTISKYLDPTSAHPEHFTIHTSCSTLLASMTVITAPIDMLYKVYKKGFKKKRSHCDEDSVKGYVSHWLSWLRPELIPFGKTQVDDLQTTSALYIVLRLLTTKPEISWTLLLQSLLMKDYTLPILLLTNLGLQRSKIDKSKEANSDKASLSNGKQSRPQDKSEIFEAAATVLVQCSEFPEALARVFLPVFERTDSWGLFDNKVAISKPEDMPPWLKAISTCLDSFIMRAIDPGLRVLLSRHNEPVGTEPIALRLKELPCGCKTNSDTLHTLGNKVLSSTWDVVAQVLHNHPDLKGNKDVTAEALYSVITQVVKDVSTLPSPVVIFFKAAQKYAADKGVHTPHGVLGIKVLATSLKLRLSDVSYLESLVGEKLPSEVIENLTLLAECVYHIFAATSYAKGSGTPKLAGMFLKANRNWVSDQIEILSDHFTDQLFELPSVHPLEGHSVEFAENLLMAQTSMILSLPQGEKSLTNLYHLIHNNQTWIFSQLDIPPLLGLRATPIRSYPTPSITAKLPQPFNPLAEYKLLGECLFDHASIVAFPWDWSAMLYSDLGLSESGFRNLLFNRHELQDGAYLEENEKKTVEHLRRRFHADSPEL